MDDAAMKHMASNFAKLNKFEGVDFRRWQKKMHFLLSSMSVVYVLTTSNPDDGDDATVDQIRKKAKWDNDDYVCRGLILKGTEDIDGSVVHEVATDEVVQQPESELRKSKRNRTPKDFGPEFQLYLIEGTRDEVSDQHSYCFNVGDDPKTFDEAMKSQDVAF
ncbi:hypothetical protein Tco_1136149 [Tanacetum coccineum]